LFAAPESRDFDVVEGKEGSNVHEFEGWISSALDVYKGIFIVFMLTEHTRSAFNIGMTTAEPIMQFVSQVACSLDMTCFSTAYGFSCYRAYLTNSKNRPMKTQLSRLSRSVGLIVAAAWACNISFELAVLQIPLTWEKLWQILTFEIVYWDFLTTFPVMLLTAFLTTKPLLAIAAKQSSSIVRLIIFAVLLVWPLWASTWAYDTCPTTVSKYASLFIGCVRRSLGVMRFSAFTYMFYFNFGCIVSLLTLEFSRSGANFPGRKAMLRQPHWIAYIVLLNVELWFAVPLLQNYNTSWEYLNWEGYRRFPQTMPLILAWGFLSQCVGFLALFATALLRPRIMELSKKLPELFKKLVSMKCAILEHFGANVLLYLTVSNFVLHGFFHVNWREFQLIDGKKKAKNSRSDIAFTIRSWEYIVLAAAVGQILFVQLLSYLVRSSRK
jgi:hypothetical protein